MGWFYLCLMYVCGVIDKYLVCDIFWIVDYVFILIIVYRSWFKKVKYIVFVIGSEVDIFVL